MGIIAEAAVQVKRYLNTQYFSLRTKTSLRDLILLLLISCVIFYVTIKLVVPIGGDILMLIPTFGIITVVLVYAVTKMRILEVAEQAIIIWRGNTRELELPKSQIQTIEINFGFNWRVYYIGSFHHQRHYFAKMKFNLNDGVAISRYKIRNTDVYSFKTDLNKYGYPEPVEYLRGKPMSDKNRRLI